MIKLCVYYVYCVCMLYNVYIVYIMCNANLCQVCVSVTLLLLGLFTIHGRSSCFNRKTAICKMQPDSGFRPGNNALVTNPRFIRRHYNITTDNYVCIMHLMLGAGRRE